MYFLSDENRFLCVGGLCLIPSYIYQKDKSSRWGWSLAGYLNDESKEVRIKNKFYIYLVLILNGLQN